MVRAVSSSRTKRAVHRAIAWIPAPIRSYVIALIGLVLLSLIARPILHGSPRPAGLPGVLLILFFLVVLLGSSWLGYGAGIMSWTLATFVLPRILSFSQRQQRPDILRFALLLSVSLLISYIGSGGRRREAELTRAAEELEERVRERTADAER